MPIDEIYTLMRQTIFDSIKDDWQIAILYVERLDKYVGAIVST